MNIYLLLGAGVVVAALTGGAYFKGKAADRERSDAVILRMQNDAAAKLAAANAKNIAASNDLQATKERAEHALQAERQRAARRAADAVATDRVVREQLASLASGPGADQDSLAACRSDARNLGDVLGVALQAHGVCSDNAEAEAANARTLLAAWPAITHQGEVK